MAFTRPSRFSLGEIVNQLFNSDTTTLTVGTSPTLPSTLTSDKKVTCGTTAIQLVSSTTAARRCTIQAFASNTNTIAVGGSNVVAAADTTAIGIQLSAGDAFEFDIDDLSKMYIRAITSGEGVTFVATA